MMKLSILLSIIILIILFIYNIHTINKSKKVIRKELHKKIQRIKVILYIISILLFVVFLIINLYIIGDNPTDKEIISSFIKAISVAIISLPISLETLYIVTFKDEENYSHIKTIVTNIYNKEIFNKFNNTNINILLLSNNKTELKTISEEKITTDIIDKTLQIKTDNNKILDKIIDKQNTIKEFKSLENLYTKIINARHVHDKYIKTIKYLVATYCPIIISYLFLIFMGFPVTYNLLLVVLLKLYTTISSRVLFKNLPDDKTVDKLVVKPADIIIPKQEILLLSIDCFIIFFGLSLPYMYVLAKDAGILFGNTLYFTIFSIINILLPYYYMNDSCFLYNIFKYIKSIRIHVFTIINIIFIIFINNNNFFITRNITLHNIYGCIIISIFTIIILELTKLARYVSMKGMNKNATKHNKRS